MALISIAFITSASVSHSGIIPADNSRHAEIVNNPPDNAGYVRLNFTLTDGTGGSNMEFYLDVFTGGSWVNRQHQIDIASGSFHQDELAFNTTCTDYQWRIHAYDPDDSTWNNVTYDFKSDCKPDAPSNPSPANNTYLEQEYITLSMDVYHSDDASVDMYDVNFYEYPSGRLIGTNHTNTGWSNGTTVTCNTTLFARDAGQRYYWFAQVKDDEYWSENSSVNKITCFCNDTLSTDFLFLHGFIDVYDADTEPNLEYHILYGDIKIGTNITIDAPAPADNETDVYYNHVIEDRIANSANISMYTPRDVEVILSTNKSGSWVVYHTETISDNATIFDNFTSLGLNYGKTIWWNVSAENLGNGDMFYASFNFTINNQTPPVYGDTVTDFVFLHGFIDVYDADTEPNLEYHILYGDITVGKPFEPRNPYPENGSSFGQHFLTGFSCYVTDSDGDDMTITFYNANTGIPWATVTGVASGTRAETTVLPSLTNGSLFKWYTTVDDESGWNITGETWEYTPQNQVPIVWMSPDEGDDLVQVNRKSVAGEWQEYVKLLANVSDSENDTISINIYVDDPSIGNWNDWILRLAHADDESSFYNNNIYRQDELTFQQTTENYHWMVEVDDGYDSATYYVNFTTEFYFWADYDWTPSCPTNEDIVTLIDKSVNATDIRWMIDGVTIAEANYSSGSHAPFNVIKYFNISDVHNISMWIYNDTNNIVEEIHAETTGMNGFLYVDRNVTINSTDSHAGYNYHTYHLNGDTTASALATNLSLQQGWWLHKYDTVDDTWMSHWLYPSVNNGTGDNFGIETWDSIVITADQNIKERVNISEDVTTSQSKTITSNYNYLTWSSSETTTSQSQSIGLQTGDWLYKYDTQLDVWYGEWIGMAGDNFIISSYDTIVAYPAADRNINIGED